jgi:uncharacterized protein (DUF433 family)
MTHGEPRQAKQSVSFRFDSAMARRLKDHAAALGTGQTALVERYVEEGIRRDEHPLIYFRDGAAGRRAALIGSRLDVAEVIATVRQNGGSVEEAGAYLEVPVEQIEAAVSYYGAYKGDVDEQIDRARLVAERERERWLRGREALA